jgi:hypothetical protein
MGNEQSVEREGDREALINLLPPGYGHHQHANPVHPAEKFFKCAEKA